MTEQLLLDELLERNMLTLEADDIVPPAEEDDDDDDEDTDEDEDDTDEDEEEDDDDDKDAPEA